MLKDAAATAIYGSRGANGVVMVTTRSGKAGVPRVVFDHSVGIQKLRKKLEMMNSDEWYNFTKAYYVNSGLALPGDFPAAVPSMSTDWQDETFRTALLLNNSVSVSVVMKKAATMFPAVTSTSRALCATADTNAAPSA